MSVFVFGTAKSVRAAALGRWLSGLLNGNAAIVKTYLGETSTKKAQSEAFGVLALGYGLASTLAPAAAGFLQRPARRWPETFAGTAFDTYPYLLPMCVAACLTGLGAVLGVLLLPETASFVRRAEAKATARNGDEEKRLVKLASAGDLRAIELRDVDEWSDVAGDKGEADDFEDVAPKEVLFTPETTRAVACYAVLAAIAIGYDEMLPVFLKTTKTVRRVRIRAARYRYFVGMRWRHAFGVSIGVVSANRRRARRRARVQIRRRALRRRVHARAVRVGDAERNHAVDSRTRVAVHENLRIGDRIRKHHHRGE